MPHVVIKMYADRSDAEKQALADAITMVMMDVLGHDPDKVSIDLEEVAPSRWMTDVYEPDILRREAHLLKRPGYGPIASKTSGRTDASIMTTQRSSPNKRGVE